MIDALDQLAAQLADATSARDAYRTRERAVALRWSRAQGDIVHATFDAAVRVDDKGFHLASVRTRGARGRSLRRSRVEALIEAGFLYVDGADVLLTNDGYDAYMCWSLNVDASVEADAELECLPPLAGGEEAGRRRAAWEVEARAAEARMRDQVERINAAAMRAEAELAALPALREAEVAGRARGAWAEVYGPEVAHTYTDADRGDVVTTCGVDLDPALEVELAALAVVVEAEVAEQPAAAVEPAVVWNAGRRAVVWNTAAPVRPRGARPPLGASLRRPAVPATRTRAHGARRPVRGRRALDVLVA